MAEKVVSVRLTAITTGFTAGMAKAKKSVDDLTKADVPKAAKGYKDLADKAALAGAAMAVGLGVAVKRFADFDKAMSAVKANVGGTAAEMELLRQAAIQLGADSQFSATEAAGGINELGKAGVKSADILGGGLKGALDLAAAGQIEVAQAAETTASAMTQFKLSGDKASHVADLLASGANKAQGGVGDLGAALGQAGLVAASTGLSIEETTGGLTAFASAGLIGSDAGTSFKTMLQRLNAPSAESAAVMKELGISAYDSQGNFVGLANVAEQLKNGMEDLTPAQRNAAMATIFGSDAIRASNVLYEQGAAGINKWVDAVDEQGAAARQAATLTDNLTGDLERLGGAFDTALIQTGSGANDSLRTLVQGLEGLVTAVGKIPGPLLLLGGGLSAIALVAPKGVLAFRDYKAKLDAITVGAPRAAKALNAFANAAAIGAAVFVTAQAFDELGKQLERLRGMRPEGVESAKASILDGSDAAEKFATNLDLTTGAVAKAQTAMSWLVLPTRLLGGSMSDLKESVGSYDTALADLVASGNGQIAADFIERAGLSAADAKDALPQYAEALAGAGNAAKLATGPSSGMAGATRDLGEKAKTAEEALADLKSAIDGLGSTAAQQRAAERDFQSAIDDATASVKENGRTLDEHTEKGRANQAALDEIATATKAKVLADFELTGSTEDATKAMQEGRDAFIDAAVEAGATKKEAKLLADQLGLIPSDVSIIVSQSGAAEAGAAIERAAVDQYATIWVSRKFRTTDLDSEFQGVGGRAMGGAIHGPGSGTSDTAGVFRLSNGEHVWTAAEVAKAGGQSAMYALRAAVRAGRLPGMATGGAVRYAPAVSYAGPTSHSTSNDSRFMAEQVTIMTNDANSFKREIRTAPYRAKGRPGR